MKCVAFGKINKKLLIPVLGGIITLIHVSTRQNMPKYKVLKKNPFLLNVYVSIGMILAFIPHLILKKEIQRPDSNSSTLRNESKLDIHLIYNRGKKKINVKKYLLILLSEIFDFTQGSLFSFFSFNCIYQFWTFDILLMSLFSRLILKIQLYRHQYISIIIIIICGLIMNILEYYKQVDVEDKLDFFGISMAFLSEICLCLSFFVIKYNMVKTFCNPYEICIWEGTLSLIFNTIILIVINCLKLKILDNQYPDNFYELFGNYNLYDFLVFLVVVAAMAIYNIALFTTSSNGIDLYLPLILGIVQ